MERRFPREIIWFTYCFAYPQRLGRNDVTAPDIKMQMTGPVPGGLSLPTDLILSASW